VKTKTVGGAVAPPCPFILPPLADLIVRALFAGNPSWVQTVHIDKWHTQVEEEPTREIADWGKVIFVSEFSYLFPQEQLVPIVGHEVTPYLATRILSTMVSTRSRAEVKKQPKAGPTAPFNITLDLAAILEGQVKMQQELANLRKHSADEMEALKQENSRLRRKIEV